MVDPPAQSEVFGETVIANVFTLMASVLIPVQPAELIPVIRYTVVLTGLTTNVLLPPVVPNE